MNRTEYRIARRFLRENGRYALRWMDKGTRSVMMTILTQPEDKLAERARNAALIHVSPGRLILIEARRQRTA